MTKFYIARHGETEWNVLGKVQGHTDIGLTKQGEEQARSLAKELVSVHFDQVFSSDLVRARRTAEIVALERKLAVITTNVLREQLFGKYEGMYSDEFRALFTRWSEMSEEEKHTFKLSDDVESNEQAVSRLIIFIRELATAYPQETILVVAHGGIMRNFLYHLGYWSYSSMKKLKNTAYIVVECDGIDFTLQKVEGVHDRE